MDEVYPWEGEYKDTSFFDPSCGSGIFLVEAYRRLVCRWMAQNDVHTINCDQLNLLLKNSIFGVDINEEAIRVASFSLSLAMCDFLDPRSIWDKLSFPRLLDNNLISSDFSMRINLLITEDMMSLSAIHLGRVTLLEKRKST